MPTTPDYRLAISHPAHGGSAWRVHLTVVTDVRPPRYVQPIMDNVMIPAHVPLHPDALVWYYQAFGQDDLDMAHLATLYWRGEAIYATGAPAALRRAADDSARLAGRVWVAWNPFLARWETGMLVEGDGVTPRHHPAWRVLASFWCGDREHSGPRPLQAIPAGRVPADFCGRCGTPDPMARGPRPTCPTCTHWLQDRPEFTFLFPPIGMARGDVPAWRRRNRVPPCPWSSTPVSAETCPA